jgi:hypothetical protein
MTESRIIIAFSPIRCARSGDRLYVLRTSFPSASARISAINVGKASIMVLLPNVEVNRQIEGGEASRNLSG